MTKSNAEQWFRENGPVTYEDAEYEPTTMTLKQAGIRRLKPTKQSGHSSGSGSVNAVYYFPDAHSKIDILETFFEANPRWKELSTRKVVQNLPKEFREPVRELEPWRPPDE